MRVNIPKKSNTRTPNKLSILILTQKDQKRDEYWQKTLLDDLQGVKKNIYGLIPNSEGQHPEKVPLLNNRNLKDLHTASGLAKNPQNPVGPRCPTISR